MECISRHLSLDECVQAATWVDEGWSYRNIVQRLGISHTTISRVIQRYRETQDHQRYLGQGRPRKTTALEDRFLRISVLRERFTTYRDLQRQLETIHEIQVSFKTVRRRLAEHDLHHRQPATGSPFTVDHRRARLAFVREHIN
ncbi:HTH Tnp Tc3 2 domain containing protein [Asbolus verrucosus]|uniref:HTH Tnp Tc3 2 domain containing protein n=1 Tax=Asbolus verrucosus TaxID=1661398 RepID=A0A482W6R7_ASBVE|nr:HTH Tnp Tc3 2 domain containing protein [Asbolus verrucosus]